MPFAGHEPGGGARLLRQGSRRARADASGCAPARQGHGLRQPVRILLRQKGSRCSATKASTAPSWPSAPQTRCWRSVPSQSQPARAAPRPGGVSAASSRADSQQGASGGTENSTEFRGLRHLCVRTDVKCVRQLYHDSIRPLHPHQVSPIRRPCRNLLLHPRIVAVQSRTTRDSAMWPRCVS